MMSFSLVEADVQINVLRVTCGPVKLLMSSPSFG